jgi:hypothetical protein
MTRRRDLTGFGSAPLDDQPGVQPDSGELDRPPSTERHDRVRITLSIPVDSADALRQASERDGRFYLDIVGEAFTAHRSEVAETYRQTARSSSLGARPLRRRRPPGRVQVALVLTARGLAELDEAAREVELDRSSYVAELLARHLG